MAAKKTAASPPAKSPPTDAELAASLRATWDLFRQRLDSPRVRALIPAAADLVDALATALEEPQDKDRALAVAHSCADAIVHVLEGAGPFPLRHDLVQVAHTLDHAILETFGEDREPSDDVHLFKAWSGRAPWKLSKRTNALVYGDLLRRAREGLVRYAPAASVGIGHVAAMAAKNVAYFFAWFDRRPGYPLGATVDKVAAAAAAYKLGLSLRVIDISGSGPQTFDPDHVVYAALEGAGLTADERELIGDNYFCR